MLKKTMFSAYGVFIRTAPFYAALRYIFDAVICIDIGFGRHFLSELLVLYGREASACKCLAHTVHLPYLVDD